MTSFVDCTLYYGEIQVVQVILASTGLAISILIKIAIDRQKWLAHPVYVCPNYGNIVK